MIWYIVAAVVTYFFLKYLHKKWYQTSTIIIDQSSRRIPRFKETVQMNTLISLNQNRRKPTVSKIDNPLYYPHCPVKGCHNSTQLTVIVKKSNEKFYCTACNYNFGKPEVIN
jgi:hypothetical protein